MSRKPNALKISPDVKSTLVNASLAEPRDLSSGLVHGGELDTVRGPSLPAATTDFELIELLFFAYRDFVGEPDRLLARHSFGRAHHRVLHFVNRHQGLNVAELLEILEITKQSLARVLKDLINAGFVQQKAGAEDRRQRLLFLTPRGKELAEALAGMQAQRMARALSASGPQHRPIIARFLAELIDKERASPVPQATGLTES